MAEPSPALGVQPPSLPVTPEAVVGRLDRGQINSV